MHGVWDLNHFFPFFIIIIFLNHAYSYTYVFFVIPIILRVWWGLVALFCILISPHQAQVQVNKNIKKKKKKNFGGLDFLQIKSPFYNKGGWEAICKHPVTHNGGEEFCAVTS